MTNFNNYIEFDCIKITQPIGTFYIGVIDSSDLLKISYADIRRIEKRDVEKYLGIQRPLVDKRVSELHRYVNLIDATFPSSIILAISSQDIEYDQDKCQMRIRAEENIAKIIDGQHRIAGLEKFQGRKFQLNLTIFIDMDLEDQAMVFSTINLKQTKVNKSLAYDLYDLAKSRSPQKTCHNIAKLVNSKKGSPFFNKVRILGLTEDKGETITQATFVESLIQYISGDPMNDRDLLKRGKKLEKISMEEAQKYIFRNLFIEDKDAVIASIIWNYFSAVEQRWTHAWREVRRGNILNKSTGFKSLMKFLRPVYLSFSKPGEIISKDSFSEIFKEIDLADADFNIEKYKPGGIGESVLYKDLIRKSGLGE